MIIKKTLLSLALVSTIFANEVELNKYFIDNNISINCINNECTGTNIQHNAIKIDSIYFKLKDDFKFNEQENTKSFNDYCLQQTNDLTKCNKIIKETMFTNLLTSFAIDGTIIIKNGLFNTLKFDNLTTNNNLPIFNVFEDFDNLKKIKLNDLISNKIEANIYNLENDFNDFDLFLNYVNSNLKELSKIPKEEWNDEIANDVEFNLNLRYVLNKYNTYSKKNKLNKDISLSLVPFEDKKNNMFFYNLKLNIKDDLKYYEINAKLSLKDIKGITKNFDKINNKELAITLLLPSFNINELNVILKNEKMNELHKDFLINDIKYKNAFDTLIANLPLDNNDNSMKKINNFIVNFLNMKYNNHNINIKNQNNKELFKILTNILNKKEINIDDFINSLNIDFKSF